MSVHSRAFPHGVACGYKLPLGKPVEQLRYKQKLKIIVEGKERNAVVDLIVIGFWGGPSKAFTVYDSTGELFHVWVKLVWCEPDGDWRELRRIRDATEEEFLAWRKEFKNGVPPTPMP